MKQYLVLKFTDAKAFNGYNKNHKMLEFNGTSNRSDNNAWVKIPVDTLYVNHVSNMLHVLMGERPVPSLRKVFSKTHKVVDDIFELAKSARIAINSGLHSSNNDDVLDKHNTEVMMTRKSALNSYAKLNRRSITLNGKVQYFETCNLSWIQLMYHMGKDKYIKFTEMINQVIGIKNHEDFSVITIFEKLNASKNQLVADFCQDAPKVYKSILIDGVTKGQYFHQGGYGKLNYMFNPTIVRGVETVSSIGGLIYVPVDDKYIEKLRNGHGFAKILEGGLVTIKGFQDITNDIQLTTKPVFMGAK